MYKRFSYNNVGLLSLSSCGTPQQKDIRPRKEEQRKAKYFVWKVYGWYDNTETDDY